MSELRFIILVRREGESVHDSEKFGTEEFADIEELIDNTTLFIRETYEAEADAIMRGERDDA